MKMMAGVWAEGVWRSPAIKKQWLEAKGRTCPSWRAEVILSEGVWASGRKWLKQLKGF